MVINFACARYVFDNYKRFYCSEWKPFDLGVVWMQGKEVVLWGTIPGSSPRWENLESCCQIQNYSNKNTDVLLVWMVHCHLHERFFRSFFTPVQCWVLWPLSIFLFILYGCDSVLKSCVSCTYSLQAQVLLYHFKAWANELFFPNLSRMFSFQFESTGLGLSSSRLRTTLNRIQESLIDLVSTWILLMLSGIEVCVWHSGIMFHHGFLIFFSFHIQCLITKAWFHDVEVIIVWNHLFLM